jgi:hypothetical protein
MSTTFGEIRFRASKLPHGAGVDFDLLNGMINDRLQEIVRHYEWSRLLEADAVLALVAVYETGTLQITNASTAVTLTGGTFTTGMTGRRLRVAGREESYVFTFASGSTGTLDRVYEGDTDTEASFKIFKNVYALASDVGQLFEIKDTDSNFKLSKKSLDWLDRNYPARLDYGEPTYYAMTEDSSSVPQVELYPIPEVAEGLTYRYKPTVARITATSTALPDWVSIECLFAGIEADLYQLQKDISLSQVKEMRFQKLLAEMVREDSNRKPSEQMQMAARFTAHRADRVAGDVNRAGRSQMLQSMYEES